MTHQPTSEPTPARCSIRGMRAAVRSRCRAGLALVAVVAGFALTHGATVACAQDATAPVAAVPTADPAADGATTPADAAVADDAAAAVAGDVESTDESLSPEAFERLKQDLRARQARLSARAVAYLWDQRMDARTGRIGKVQGRYLQALCYLALVADGHDSDPVYATRLAALLDDLRQPIAALADEGAGGGTSRKVYVGTSRDVLAFETHAVVALAYQQLATAELPDLAANQLFLKGADSAIEYVLDYRKRGRTYENAGGWPVNATPYNRNRPDRRTTAWLLMLMKTQTYLGHEVNSTAMTEGPGFVLAAQRLAPPKTDELKAAETVYKEWGARMRRGEEAPPEVRDKVNAWLDYTRRVGESGGFGVDTIGIVSPGATAVGLWTLGQFEPDSQERYADAVRAWRKMPLTWDAQRFFLTQFFAVRGLYTYSEHYGTQDYYLYMNRLLSMMELRQNGDGSFPLGSFGVEELTQMELVYTTAMCVLILNADRGNLLLDRPAY